jgi:hypothetical protein
MPLLSKIQKRSVKFSNNLNILQSYYIAQNYRILDKSGLAFVSK